MVAHNPTPPPGGDVGKLVLRRSRGEAIDIATAAGLKVRITVLSVDGGQVRLMCIAPREVKFATRTRQEAERDEAAQRR